MPSTTLGPKLGFLINCNRGDEYSDVFRPFLRAFDTLVMSSVLSSSTAAPPSSPSNGDAYILPTNGLSGAWSAHGGQIAVWSTEITTAGTDTKVPGWDFYTPKEGWRVWDVSQGKMLTFVTGAWTAPSSSGLSDPGANGLLKRTSANTTAVATGADIPTITESQVTNLVSDLASKASTATFTTSAAGLAPASGGGTTNFLRADGTWAAPPSSTGLADPGSNGLLKRTSAGVTAVATAADIPNITESQVTNLTTDLAAKAPLVSPTFTTPTLGVATATSINKITITAPASGATLTLANGSSLITSGAFSVTLTATATTTVTLPTSGTLATTATVTSGAAGLAPASGGGTTNFLRADGTWAAPTVSTPVFTSSTSGIVPASGGGTTNFLRADGTWAAQAGGAGISSVTHDTSMTGDGNAQPLSLGAIQTKSTNYTMLVGDYVCLASGTITVTLTTSGASACKVYRVKNVGSGVITVQGATGTIDGSATATLSVPNQAVDFIFDGTNFFAF